jgi:hypothetical protein
MMVRSCSNFAVLRSLSACLASSSPLQLWLSNIRCLPQKRFWQNPQSPTIGCASALHPSFVQRGLFDLRLVPVGVLVPDVVVEDGAGESVASDVDVISEDSGSCEPRDEGVKRLRVEDSDN